MPLAAFAESEDHAKRILRGCGLPERHVRTGPVQGPFDAKLDSVSAMIGTGFLVLLVGDRGNGKTQFATRLAWLGILAEDRYPPKPGIDGATPPEGLTRWREARPVLYRHAMSIFLDVRESFGQNGERKRIEAYCAVPMLIIDEFQERGNTAWEDRLLTYIIDRRYGAMKDTLMIGNVKGDEETLKAQLGASIVSRASEAGGVIVADWPSYRGRAVA